MEKIYKILIVDDEIEYRETLKLLLESAGYQCEMASGAMEALELMKKKLYPIVVTDIMMEGMDGIDFLKKIKKQYGDDVNVIMVTGYGSIETAVETMKIGAFGYFIKSHNPAELLIELEKLVKSMDYKTVSYVSEVSADKFLTSSANRDMQRVWEMVDTIADTNANVLILGESGTGKEIVANEIHKRSKRRNKPFIPINCQNFPSNLIESELFGHEKGAFTGALDRRIGKLEQGNGGTIFFDEIGDMGLESQIKLLRTLENKKIERLGSNREIDVNFRVVSATNRDISKLVSEGLFREDFLYRINTIELRLPALRQRREDIKSFLDYFITKFTGETGKRICGMDKKTEDFLLNYDYPGNIREMKNMVERLVIFSDSDGILRIENTGIDTSQKKCVTSTRDHVQFKEAKAAFEKEYIIEALKDSNNNITKAAEQIGLSRRQLFNKIKEYQINVDE